MDFYFNLYNISPKTTNKINTTQGDNKFTNNQHYHYLQQKTMSNVSDNEEEAPPAEAEVVDDMETITASVEEVSLSENTPDVQRKSTDNDADIHYNYKKSNSKNAQIIVRVIHPGSRVTKEYTRITNNHTTSATETKTPTKEFEATPGKEDQGLLFSPPAILPELSARRTLVYEVPKVREAKAITSRRQKLRNHDKEGYTASLEKERKRKYLIKNRNRGLGDPSASVGVDSPNPDGGVAGEPPASVGEVTQPPTGAPAVDLSTAQPNPPTAARGGDGETGGQKRKRTFTVVKKKAGGKGGKGRVSKPQTSHPALVPKPEPSPLLSGGETVAPSGGSKDREGRQATKGKAAVRENRSRPYPTTSPNTTRAGLRSPEEVFNTKPTVALYAKKEGESQPAEAVELFMLPEQYSLSGIYPDQDGVRLEAADQESADVLLRHLRASGWTVTASPIWPRYSFASPPSLSNRFTPEQIVAGLIMRNPELPPGALRFAGSHEAEGGEGSAEGTTRRLVWVDVDPDALEYLRSVDFLLRTVSGAVRLREAPRNKRPPKRS